MNSLIYILVPWESKTIPKPTPAQLKYQKNEIMALIHFNMATFAKDGDPGCSEDNWNKHQKYASGPTYVVSKCFKHGRKMPDLYDSKRLIQNHNFSLLLT